MRLLPLLCLLLAPAAFADGPVDVDALVQKAHAQHLAEENQWLRLVHYVPVRGGLESEADGPAFFVSPTGKHDPSAELDATLRAFFQPEASKGREHAICQFPARLAWLYSQLHFDLNALPQKSCDKLRDFLGRVAPTSATLMFSSYYLNNPASAFGHTFLRLNKAPREQRGTQDELRDYAINFAATVPPTTNNLFYGLGGMTGAFHGDWTYMLYFYKVREYSEYESRDLWEYDLALNPGQLALLTAHLWELGSTWFDYYYIDENCSYQILRALEAVLPDRDLSSKLKFFVLPADTVRAVMESPGLVSSIHYRASIEKQFRARAAGLSGDALELVRALDRDWQTPLPPMPLQRQAAVLDAALDYVDLRDAKVLIHQSDPIASERKQRLLERRSEVRVPTPPLEIAPPFDKEPHLGHYSSRVGFGGGSQAGGSPYVTLDLRGAFHDLADQADGYPDLAQIEFFPTRLRFNAPFKNVTLEHTYLARILSLVPLDRFNLRPSWNVRIGASTVRDGGCPLPTSADATMKGRGCLAAEVGGGTGFAGSFLGERLTLWGMADAELHASPAIDGPWGAWARPSVGPTLGLRMVLGSHLTVVGSGTYWFHGEEGGVRRTYDATLTGRIHISPRVALNLEAHALTGLFEASAMTLVYF
jgi:hypothetical protein